MAPKPLPSPHVLRQLLDYDPDTGFLTWKKRGSEWFADSRHQTAEHVSKRWNARFAGKRAFTAKCKGYHVGNIGKGQLFRANRVIWAMVYGEWPDTDIDHKNTKSADDRLNNLRKADGSQNSQNRRSRENKTGFRGVKEGRTGRWTASITANGQRHYLGSFPDPKQAHAAYQAAAANLHGEFRFSL